MGHTCSCGCCVNTKKYVRLSDTVLLETNEDRTMGAYYFHPKDDTKVPEEKACNTGEPIELNNEVVEDEHRYTSLINESMKNAVATFPKKPDWNIVFEDKKTSFCVWEKPGECHLATIKCENVFAEEVATTFWDPDDKDWDSNIESCSIVERLTSRAYVSHMIFKEVWPTTQRDCVSCTSLQDIGKESWAVCTRSVEHASCPESKSKSVIRMKCDVNLIARQRWKNPLNGTTRDNSECYIFYTAMVDPKGWIPQTIIRHFTIKKWPEFLKTLHEKAL